MRRLVPILALVAAVAVVLVLQFGKSSSRSGYTAPDFRLPDLDGATHQLADYRGKVVFLNVWATWCPPCRDEMPSMERLHQRYAREGLVLLAVSEDEGAREQVETFVRSLNLTFPILLDPEGVIPRAYGVTGYPETFLIDRSGRIVEHKIGPADWYSDGARAMIETLLAAAPPESDE